MANPRPEYKVYRARRRPLPGRPGGLDELRRRLGRDRGPGERRELTPGRVVRWLALAAGGWLLLSVALFLISSAFEGGVSASAERALSGKGTLLGGSTVLVLGSDQRTGASIDKSQTGPPRADSIMLVHAAFGSVRKLSIPRDAYAPIPGHATQKINAAYAFGGSALMVKAVEGYLGNGLRINHVVEVDFADFPALINALGGITVDVPRKICSPPFDNFWKGLKFEKGRQELDGTRALGYSRVRKNHCAANETDLDRAARQQQVLNAIRSKLLSPTTFFRLPWVSWKAPKTLKTDMAGPSLMALFTDLATGGSSKPRVLQPSCLSCGPEGSLTVSEAEKQEAVRKLIDG